MTKSSIIPMLLLVAAVGLFFTFTDHKYQEIKNIQAQVATYDTALDNSKNLLKIRDGLLLIYNSISSENLNRLELLLPDTVDNIRLVLDIDTIASRHGIIVKNLKLNPSALPDNFDSTVENIKSIDLSFSVDSDYRNFLSFIRDLEDSLRIIDLVEIKFIDKENFSNTPATQNVTIRTYWMP